MQLQDFYDNVEAHDELRGIKITDEHVVVEHSKSGMVAQMSTEFVDKNEWDLIEDLLIGRRQPNSLQHITRVVGYFSRLANWNSSKIAEHRDRKKGNYGVAAA